MTPQEVLADSSYPALKSYILDHTGLNYYADKDDDLAGHIAHRASELQFKTCRPYLNALNTTEQLGEMEALVSELTIGETYFFRQREHFDLIRDTILPDLLQRNAGGRRLRIWSAGCATGAEPYSLALLLSLEFAARLEHWDVSILATDINTAYLKQARIGTFSKWALRDVPEDLKAMAFDFHRGKWQIKAQYRQMVTFEHHNLVTGALPYGQEGGGFDLILCRNVLIYFSRQLIEAVANKFYEALADGGWLLVGHAEPNSEIFGRFATTLTPSTTAYRKLPVQRASVGFTIPLIESGAEKRSPPTVLPTARPKVVATVAAEPKPSSNLSLPAIQDLADRGHWKAAEEACRRLVEASPLDEGGHFALGMILQHTARESEAQTAFRRAIYLDRSFALAHFQLGASLSIAGDRKQARKSFENVILLLEGQADERPIAHGGGMTVADLRELTGMHLALMPVDNAQALAGTGPKS